MTAVVSAREERILGIIETARGQAREVPRRAHHDGPRRGRQGDPGADRGPARCRPSARRRSRRWATPGAVPVDGAELAMTTDCFVVKPIRFPGGSIGDLAVNGTVNDLAVSGARPLALTLALILEEGLDADDLRAEVEAIAAAAEAAGVRDRRRRHEGGRARPRRPDVRLHDRRRAAATRAPDAAPDALRPGDRILALRLDRRARHGDHAGPRRVRARRRDRVRHPLAVARRRRAARGGRARRCTACATPPAAAWPPCSTSWRAPRSVAMVVREAAVPVHPAVAGAGRDPRHRPDVRGQRGQARRVRRPEDARTRRSPRCAPCRAASSAAEIGEVRTEPPGMVLVETAFGGKRVMDQLVGDPLPRIC